MLKHVLVPLDGSKLAEDAIKHALDLLGPGGKVTLVSAVDVPEVPIYGYYPPTTVPDYESAKDELLPQAKSYLESVAAGLGEMGVTIAIEAQVGEPAHVITEFAQKFHVDAIVMSTHGRSGLSRWLFGSVTNKVLSAKPCPVYVVPSHQPQAGEAQS
jgi:nucleotide-binding universal stress UspA family protein